MKRRQQSFLFLEIMVALALLATLAFFLFESHKSVTLTSQWTRHAQEEETQTAYLHERLKQLLSKATLGEKGEKGFCFYTHNNGPFRGAHSLLFTCNHGIDRDPNFSKEVLVEIYIDRDERLCLLMSPFPGRGGSETSSRQEVLLDGVKSLEWIFYVPPQRGSLVVKPGKIDTQEKIEPPAGKQGEWSSRYSRLPCLVTLVLKREPLNELSFTYFVEEGIQEVEIE